MSHTAFQEGCPWYFLTQIFGLPDIQFCEAMICEWINNPSLALSNFLYLAFGLYFRYKAKGSLEKKFSYTFIFIGICSFVYHSTNNGLTQFLDLFGIFCFLSFIQYINSIRINKESKIYFYLPLILLSLSFWIFRYFDISVQILVMLYAPIIVLQELFLMNRKDQNRFFYYLSLAFMIFGNIANMLDVKKFACDPHNHFFQFHALWHILSALSIFYYFTYLKRTYTFK